jgi:hypothetical protein
MVISAPWLSTTGHGALNLRGISTVLSLAAFLKGRVVEALRNRGMQDIWQIIPCGRKISSLSSATIPSMECMHG